MLKNKIALITGAGRGIGRAIAIALAKEGAEVVINYNGSEERAKEVKQTIEENGGKASIYKCNVSDFAACEAMIKDIVKEYGHLDILVNNAGITKDGLIMKMKEEDFDSVLNVNLKGTFNTIRHSARQMLKQRSGKIINISSVSGILGNVGQANYAASKAGVIGLTKTMARELGSRGITVNAIAPGFVDTEMTEVLSEEIRENACKQIILGRFGKPEDIANTAVFLASDKADYITGQVISIYERYCTAVKEKAALPTGDLMVETARFFLGTPYVAGTLEEEPETLVINLHGLDCMTLVENTAALAWSVKHRLAYDGYVSVLKDMRYRNSGCATLDYTDRLHYTADWIYENEKRGYLKDVTKEVGGQSLKLDLSFMSTHPDSYKQLKGNPGRIAVMTAKEKEISARPHYYIPQDEINEHAGQIRNGDIVCFVTTVKGLDISHVGIVCRECTVAPVRPAMPPV